MKTRRRGCFPSRVVLLSDTSLRRKKVRFRIAAMRRLRGPLWLVICIALASLRDLSCSSLPSLSSKLCNWLRGGSNDGKTCWPKKLSSFSFQPQLHPAAPPPPLRVWIDSFGFAKGESTIMLEEIEVRMREEF
jgi:hypothetical protein